MYWFYPLIIFPAVTLSVLACYFVVADMRHRDERRAARRIEEFRKDAPADASAPVLFKSLDEFDLGPAAGRGIEAAWLVGSVRSCSWRRASS